MRQRSKKSAKKETPGPEERRVRTPEPTSNADIAAKVPPTTELEPETSGFLENTEAGRASTPQAPPSDPDAAPSTPSAPEAAEERPDPATQPVEFAQWKATENNARLEEIKARADAGDEAAAAEYTEALKANTADLAQTIAGMPPEQQREFLTGGGSRAADALLRSAEESGDQATINAVVQSLVQGGETLGRQNIELLGSVLGQNNSPALRMALRTSIRNGDGALLAMSTAKNSSASDAATTRDLVHSTVQQITGDFSSVTSRVKAVQGEMLAVAGRMRQAGIPEGEVVEWEQRERAKNQDLFAEHDRTSRTYASTLEGQGYAIDDTEEGPKAANQGQRETYQHSLGMAGDLAYSTGASEFTAAALQRKGQGDRTWIDTVGGLNLDETDQGLMKNVIGQGAMTGLAAGTAAGDTETVNQMLTGLEQYTEGKDAQAVARIRERINALREQGVTGDELKTRLAEEVQTAGEDGSDRSLMRRLAIGASLGANVRAGIETADSVVGAANEGLGISPLNNTRLHSGIGKMSNAIGLLTNGMNTLDEASFKNILGTAVAGAGVAADTAALLGKKGLGQLMGRASLPLGVMMSTVDLVGNLADGNYEGAAVASLPLVGAGAGAIVAGPPGAVVGFAVGSVLSAAATLAGVGGDFDLEKKTAEAITDVFKQRGLTGAGAEDLATRFAGLDANTVNQRFEHMAGTLGVDQQTLTRQLAEANAEYRDYFFAAMNHSVNFEPDGTLSDSNGYYDRLTKSMEAAPPSSGADADSYENARRASQAENEQQLSALFSRKWD